MLLRKRFDLDITTPLLTVREEFELDKHSKRVVGILVTSDRDEMIFHRGTIGVILSGEEVIPDGHHTKLLLSGLGVAPDERFLSLDLLPGNGVLKVAYTDNIHLAQAFVAHSVHVYLLIEIDEVAR
jgi:hypothetical protein